MATVLSLFTLACVCLEFCIILKESERYEELNKKYNDLRVENARFKSKEGK